MAIKNDFTAEFEMEKTKDFALLIGELIDDATRADVTGRDSLYFDDDQKLVCYDTDGREYILTFEARTARTKNQKEEVSSVVRTGVCPRCGQPLRRNLVLTSIRWQCQQCTWQGSEIIEASK